MINIRLNQFAKVALMAAALLATPAGVTSSGAVATASAQSDATHGVVNLNTATVEELTRLPGIGEAKAQAIVARRENHRFRRIEDVMRVRGIGRATFRRLRPMLTVEGDTTLSAPAHRTRARAHTSEGADD